MLWWWSQSFEVAVMGGLRQEVLRTGREACKKMLTFRTEIYHGKQSHIMDTQVIFLFPAFVHLPVFMAFFVPWFWKNQPKMPSLHGTPGSLTSYLGLVGASTAEAGSVYSAQGLFEAVWGMSMKVTLRILRKALGTLSPTTNILR